MQTRRFRLLVLTPTFPYPPVSGGDIRAFHLLRRLANTFEIHLFPHGEGSIADLLNASGIAAVHRYAQIAYDWHSSLKRRFDFWQHAPHGMTFAVDPGYARALIRLVEKERFDGVLIDHLYMTQYAKFVLPSPILYMATDVETIKFGRWHRSSRLSLKRRWLHWAQQRAVRWRESRLGEIAPVTFATSQLDRDVLARLNRRGRIVVAPNGVDLDYFRPRSRASFDKPPAIFFVGTLYYQPNRDAATFLAREVFPLVRRESPDAICHIAGKGGQEISVDLHRPDVGIVMHGFVEDTRPYLEESQILVVPLFGGSGTRIKILEAMASATPVVSSSIGAEGIEYQHGENIVIANGAIDTARAITELLRDRDRCHRIGLAGRRLVEEHYSWDASADVIRREILSVLKVDR